ncbi:MAG TPA: NIPSNAP family protein [Burkholderiales bacterium]|nr:NIPSNAP family protein [Burkholderiales bacterium]
MIRRFYSFPLKSDLSEHHERAFLRALSDTCLFIPGTENTSAARDLSASSPTVVWENTYADLESGQSVYMRHPYHAMVLDRFAMRDSPECVASSDTSTCGYELPGRIPLLTRGIRRVVLLRVPEESNLTGLAQLAANPPGPEISVFADETWSKYSPRKRDINWRKPWTHIWEQGFANQDALNRYLSGDSPAARAERAGLVGLGFEVEAIRIMTYPVQLQPAPAVFATPRDPGACMLVATANISTKDADSFVDQLEQSYDPAAAEAGMPLKSRWQSCDPGSQETVVQSTWQLRSVSSWHDVRTSLVRDPRWKHFVDLAMPLVRGGSRRVALPCHSRASSGSKVPSD